MAFHVLRASRVAHDLAARSVSPREQAGYLVISRCRSTEDPRFAAWMWFAEFALVVAIFIGGVGYCLRRCRVDAQANFLVDVSCLYIWSAFHVLATLLPWFSSAYAYDALRLMFYVGATLVIFWRVGSHKQERG